MQTTDTGWSLDIKNHSWVEDTVNQVDFVIKTLELTGKEQILDMACGFGRHSLELARRGFTVVGVDYTKSFIDDARKSARKENLNVDFIHSDIRDIKFNNEFDVVLNMADGAIGYFDTDVENLIIFDLISSALKPGGKHFMDVCNAEHAELFFPKRHWSIGKKMLSLPEFDWDKERRRMLFTDWGITFGKVATPPQNRVKDTNGIRLYSKEELEVILNKRNMKILKTFSNYYGKPETNRELQLMLYSIKE